MSPATSMPQAARADGRPLAVVTGASSGIGLELARCCALDGHDLLIAADEPLDAALHELRAIGPQVTAVQGDLATHEGVERLCAAIGDRPVAQLLANAGHGLGRGFLDQPFDALRHVIDTNVTGTLELVHRVGRDMRARRQGRILLTGSIAGVMPGAYHAVYNATKAFVDSFAYALREELRDSGVSVTVLMPGATDTRFFERAGLQDTGMGQAAKDDPATVARAGYEALVAGRAAVVPGMRNKLQAAATNVLPDAAISRLHGSLTAPGSAATLQAGRRTARAAIGGAAALAALWWLAAGRPTGPRSGLGRMR